MISIFRSLVTAAIFTLTACSNGDAAPAPPLEGASIGGEFDLTNAYGKQVRWADFAGKYRIVYFGYTYCPDICPVDVQRMTQGYAQFAKDAPDLAAKVQPIFITIDPERDSPEALRQFTSAFSDNLIGLRGTAEQTKQAADAFKVFYSRGEELGEDAEQEQAKTEAGERAETEEGGGSAPTKSANYLMDHSRVTYLFGPQGEPLATLPTDLGAEAVAAELARWVK